MAHLADERLVVTGHDTTSNQETVEIIHEALIQSWQRLRDWIDTDREFLTWREQLLAALHQWEKSRKDTGALLRGVLLAEALEWLRQRSDDIPEPEQAFIDAGQQQERQERERLQFLAEHNGYSAEFISVASHEFRGPVAVIRGQAQLLQRQLRRLEKQGEIPPRLLHIMESLERIEAQARRLNSLVNDLLDVTRIQASRLTLQCETVELMPLIMKVIEHWKTVSDHHTLILETEIPPQGVKGHWDAWRVEQILNNLIGNALKFSPDGGNVNIRIQTDGEKKQVLIGVNDEGVGIPPEAFPHLFERFYRARNVISISGIGLGLYICKELAAAHGGNIWAESAGPSKGSAFYLQLPLEKGEG